MKMKTKTKESYSLMLGNKLGGLDGFTYHIEQDGDLIATVIDYRKARFWDKSKLELVAVCQFGDYRQLDISQKAIATAKTLNGIFNKVIKLHEAGIVKPLKWRWA